MKEKIKQTKILYLEGPDIRKDRSDFINAEALMQLPQVQLLADTLNLNKLKTYKLDEYLDDPDEYINIIINAHGLDDNHDRWAKLLDEANDIERSTTNNYRLSTYASEQIELQIDESKFVDNESEDEFLEEEFLDEELIDEESEDKSPGKELVANESDEEVLDEELVANESDEEVLNEELVANESDEEVLNEELVANESDEEVLDEELVANESDEEVLDEELVANESDEEVLDEELVANESDEESPGEELIDEESVDDSPSEELIQDIFKAIGEASNGKKVKILLTSCFGENAQDALELLPKGSMLITLSNRNKPTAYQDHYTPHFKSFLDREDFKFEDLLELYCITQKGLPNSPVIGIHDKNDGLHQLKLKDYVSKYIKQDKEYSELFATLFKQGFVSEGYVNQQIENLEKGKNSLSDLKGKIDLEAFIDNPELMDEIMSYYYNANDDIPINHVINHGVVARYIRTKQTVKFFNELSINSILPELMPLTRELTAEESKTYEQKSAIKMAQMKVTCKEELKDLKEQWQSQCEGKWKSEKEKLSLKTNIKESALESAELSAFIKQSEEWLALEGSEKKIFEKNLEEKVESIEDALGGIECDIQYGTAEPGGEKEKALQHELRCFSLVNSRINYCYEQDNNIAGFIRHLNHRKNELGRKEAYKDYLETQLRIAEEVEKVREKLANEISFVKVKLKNLNHGMCDDPRLHTGAYGNWPEKFEKEYNESGNIINYHLANNYSDAESLSSTYSAHGLMLALGAESAVEAAEALLG